MLCTQIAVRSLPEVGETFLFTLIMSVPTSG